MIATAAARRSLGASATIGKRPEAVERACCEWALGPQRLAEVVDRAAGG